MGENWATRMPLPGDSDFDEGVAEDMHRHRLWIGGELNRRLPVYIKVLYPEHAGPGEDLVIVVETDDLSIAAQEIAVHFGINRWKWLAAQLKAVVLPDEIMRPSLPEDHYIEVVAREDPGHDGLRVFSVRLHVPAEADETSVPEAAIWEIEFVMHMRDQWLKHNGTDFTTTVYESLRETGSSSPVVTPENFCL